jgi:hypothetical protein
MQTGSKKVKAMAEPWLFFSIVQEKSRLQPKIFLSSSERKTSNGKSKTKEAEG